ncbi:cysteine-rich CWC family protein [Ottowia oryzae]
MTAPHLVSTCAASPGIDATRCPLCGGPNGCAMAPAGADPQAAAACWCMAASFPPALLEKVPAAARRRACICARCAAQAAAREGA